MPNGTQDNWEAWVKRAVMVGILMVIGLCILVFLIIFKYLWHWFMSI